MEMLVEDLQEFTYSFTLVNYRTFPISFSYNFLYREITKCVQDKDLYINIICFSNRNYPINIQLSYTQAIFIVR